MVQYRFNLNSILVCLLSGITFIMHKVCIKSASLGFFKNFLKSKFKELFLRCNYSTQYVDPSLIFRFHYCLSSTLAVESTYDLKDKEDNW